MNRLGSDGVVGGHQGRVGEGLGTADDPRLQPLQADRQAEASGRAERKDPEIRSHLQGAGRIERDDGQCNETGGDDAAEGPLGEVEFPGR